VEGERGQPEIAWAAREFADELADVQPLVMVFEDIHWAEEPLLELIDHLAQWVRDRALLIICLARPELLEVRPTWGGGRVRAASIELEPLPRDESERLADALLADADLPQQVRARLLDTTEGNPLFVEESARMVLESGDGAFDRIPDTLQALIAARIDRLPASEKLLLQRASVIGRVFWTGSLRYLSPEFEEELEDALDDLLLRDLLTREQRSTITGEEPYRFKHVLIREVAYGALSKSSRAEYHRKFAEWLRARADKELLEIRAYHLDKATHLLAELDGRAPDDLVKETAHVLELAGKRGLMREAHRSARKLLLRAVELEPTLERRYYAAHAAWRLSDLPALSLEMEVLARDAAEADNRWIQTRALAALAEVAFVRDADLERATGLAEQAAAVVEPDDHVGRVEVLSTRARVAHWTGRLAEAEAFDEQALDAARATGRKDLESKAAVELATVHLMRMELDQAAPLVERACELAEESGSIITRAKGASVSGRLAVARGDDVEAARKLQTALELYTEAGAADGIAFAAKELARVTWRLGDPGRAETLLRESIRVLAPLEERGVLCESQRVLAQLLLAKGQVDRAEKLALAALETVGPEDHVSRATTRVALAQVRAAQGRGEEAERLFAEAFEIVSTGEFRRVDLDVLPPYAEFLRERGREDEAAELEARLAELAPASAA
jgi:ATP/maltotriose-dependent transcriptional regulator MalT